MTVLQPADVPVIAIDGPSGSGKGSVATRLARQLGFALLDSGSLYRLLGLAAKRKAVAIDDVPALVALAEGLNIAFEAGPNETRILLDGADVTDEIRSEKVGELASHVATVPEVRTALLARQRAFRAPPGLVADGRDMGTVVFPDAPLKIYLTATAEARAERRFMQLKGKGYDASLAALLEDIRARDDRDMNRLVAPLKPAADAVVLDSTELSIDEVMCRVFEEVRQRGLA